MSSTEKGPAPGPIQLDELTIELDKRRIRRADGNRVHLTCQEQRLLGTLLESPGQVLPYAELARSLWGKADGFSGAALRRCALRLRHKLGTRHLQTIYGVGYRLTLNAERRTPNAERRQPTANAEPIGSTFSVPHSRFSVQKGSRS
jgi:DNA-binding response OmpR family regulator